MTSTIDDFHRDVVRAALSVAARHGFALGGGVAWVLHGLVDRPTEDVDLFADVDGAAGAATEEIRTALTHAGFAVHDDDPTHPGDELDLATIFAGFDRDMRELFVTRGPRTLKLSLSRLDRQHSPIIMDVGPVMSIDDLAGSKVAALISRREPRDYIDTAAALTRYTLAELLHLAHRHDPALEPDDIAQVGHYLDGLADTRFLRYGLNSADVRELRTRLAEWPRPR